MSPVPPFKYDAFISYSSLDRPWAKRLADDLTGRNLSVFYDRTSLDVGDPWAERLDDSLDLAQHLIVLWSENAERSEYVNYERVYFHLKAREVVSDPAKPPRTEIVVLLDESIPKVHNTLQMIPDLKEAKSFEKGIDALDPNVWTQVVKRIDDTVRAGRPAHLHPVQRPGRRIGDAATGIRPA